MAEKKKQEVNPLQILSTFFGFRPPINIPGTINESRRALAILRNAEAEKFVFRGGQGSTKVTNVSQPSIGRSIRLATLPPELSFGQNPKRPPKAPTTYLDFFRQGSTAQAPFGITTDPNTGEIRRLAAPNLADNARYQGMKFNLGQALEDVVPGQFKGQGTTANRRALYVRGTGGAIGPNGMAQVRPDGTWQPRDARGRLGTARPNPSAQLQQGLRTLATKNVVRQALPVVKKLINVDPRIQALMTVNDVVEGITGRSIPGYLYDASVESSKVLEKTLKKDPTVNVGPILPF